MAHGSWDSVRALLGGKGANLGEMTRLAVPVPSGFTITTEACIAYLRSEDFQRACGNRCLSGCTTTPRLNFPVTRFGLLKFALLCTLRVGIILRKLRISGPLDKRFEVSEE